MAKEPKSLHQLGLTLIALHRQGYVAVRGYSFAERDDQFGEGSITIQAVAVPPEIKPASTKKRWWKFFS